MILFFASTNSGMRWLLVMLWAGNCLRFVVAAKILAICVTPSPSHSLWCYKYMSALAVRGHQITVLGVDEPKYYIPNITTFIELEMYKTFIASKSEVRWVDPGNSRIKIMYPDFKDYNEMATKVMLQSNALKRLLKHYDKVKKPFDLIVHDNAVGDALLALVPMFGNPPLILMTAWGLPQWMAFRVGNIFNPAYVPSILSEIEEHMSFYERCKNTFFYVFLEFFYNFVTFPNQDKMMRERFGEHLPPVRYIAKQANIILINYHFAFDFPRPLLPGVIGVTGLHISEPNPLPEDIKQFMDGANEGAVLISFGTNVESSWLPKDFEQTVIAAFRQLPQRFLWKWDKDVANLPPNVRVSKWLPQADVLVHPKMRMFITHCGLASTHEAMFYKVPILALPVYFDQLDIAKTMVKRNLTIQLNIFNLTTDLLLDNIREILSNPIYKTNMVKMGELMKDTPLSARKSAVFWTEYALRHNGAPHLRSVAADMPWYQLLLLDVLAALIIALVVFVWFIKVTITFLLKVLLSSKQKTKSD